MTFLSYCLPLLSIYCFTCFYHCHYILKQTVLLNSLLVKISWVCLLQQLNSFLCVDFHGKLHVFFSRTSMQVCTPFSNSLFSVTITVPICKLLQNLTRGDKVWRFYVLIYSILLTTFVKLSMPLINFKLPMHCILVTISHQYFLPLYSCSMIFQVRKLFICSQP